LHSTKGRGKFEPPGIACGGDQSELCRQTLFKPPLIPEALPHLAPDRHPFGDGHIQGAAIIGCPGSAAASPNSFSGWGWFFNKMPGPWAGPMLQEEEISGLKGRVEASSGFGEIIGKDAKMQVVYRLMEDVASSDATILIQGKAAPAGTGGPGHSSAQSPG